MKACTTGWIEKPAPRFEIITPEEYESKYACGSMVESYNHVCKTMTTFLTGRGLPRTNSNSQEEICTGSVFKMLASYTTEALVKRDLVYTDTYEMKRFFTHKMLRSRYCLSTGLAWNKMETETTAEGFTILERTRYDNILI